MGLGGGLILCGGLLFEARGRRGLKVAPGPGVGGWGVHSPSPSEDLLAPLLI